MRKKGYIIMAIVFAIVIITIIGGLIWYRLQLRAVNKDGEDKQIIVEIESGTKTETILGNLASKGAIKNKFAAEIYVKLHEINNLQAGKYLFTGKENLKQVLSTISSGDVMDETVNITFLEGKNMRYIASQIAENTNNSTQDVYKLLDDKDYIASLIDKYWFLTEDIENTSIYYPLEGYLYPDTYSFENSDVSVNNIFEKMLDQTSKVLSKYKNQIQKSGYSVHNILTISSITELEGTDAKNRAKVARVIYNRLKAGMALGSDVTTYYAIKVDMGERDLYEKEINTYNAYNTRGPNMEGKLPVGPIASVSEESINAALNPAEGDYLYFVADKNGTMYFTNTYEEHQSTIANLQKRGLWYEYDN